MTNYLDNSTEAVRSRRVDMARIAAGYVSSLGMFGLASADIIMMGGDAALPRWQLGLLAAGAAGVKQMIGPNARIANNTQHFMLAPQPSAEVVQIMEAGF
jgi:hypothetical protein